MLWSHTKEELQLIRENTVDFLGVNYYHPKRVQAQPNPEGVQNTLDARPILQRV